MKKIIIKISVAVGILLIVYSLGFYPLFGELNKPSYFFGMFVLVVYDLVSIVSDYIDGKEESK